MSFVVPVKEAQRMEYQLPPPPVAAPALGGNGAHQVPVGVMQGTLTPHVQAQDEQHRWTQYQQLWRQHVYMNGTSQSRVREITCCLSAPAHLLPCDVRFKNKDTANLAMVSATKTITIRFLPNVNY